MIDQSKFANLWTCFSKQVQQAPTGTLRDAYKACPEAFAEAAYLGASTPVIVVLTALAALSFSTCAAYICLPNYRYRQSLVDYVEHCRHPHFPTRADLMNHIQKKRAEHRERDETKPGEPLNSSIRFIEIFMTFPLGEIDGDNLKNITEQDGDLPWIDDDPGQRYQKWFEAHRDNAICTKLAAVAVVIIVIGTLNLMVGFPIIETLIAWSLQQYPSLVWFLVHLIHWFVFIILLAGVIVPPSFALFARSKICKQARKHISRCMKDVKGTLGSDLDADVAGARSRIPEIPT